MKHFHGTPISGSNVAQAQLLRGRFAFIPWKAPGSLEIAKAVSRGFAIDNSAFSFWSSGQSPDWKEYMDWAISLARSPRFEFAIIPDVIDGSEKENDELIQRWDRKCWSPVRVPGVPVWHLHESLDRLDRLVSGRFDMVSLGSSGEYASIGTEAWWCRMSEAFGVICDDDGRPKRRIHGLRMLAQNVVESFPFYSCDSTNMAQNGLATAMKNGRDNAAWGCEVLAGRIELIQSPETFDRGRCECNLPLWENKQ